MKDFELKHGNLIRGFVSALIYAAIFIVIPFLALTWVGYLTPDRAFGQQTDFLRALEQLRDTSALIALPVVALAFLWGFYPKGASSRLLFALIGLGFIVLFLTNFFLGGPLQRMITVSAADLDPSQFLVLALFGVALGALKHARDFVTHRRVWRAAVGLPEPPLPPQPRTGGYEFGRHAGDFQSANRTAKIFIMGLVVTPAIVLIFLVFCMRVFDFTDTNALALRNALNDMTQALLLFGVPVLVLSWLRGFYPRGTISRWAFGSLLGLLMIGMFTALLLFTGLQDALSANGFDLDLGRIWLLVLVLMVFVLLRGMGELADERKAWKRQVGIPIMERKLDPNSRALDFSPGTGKLGLGFRASYRTLLKFMVVPVIIIMVVIAILHRAFSDPVGTQLINILQQMEDVALWYSLPIAAMAFGRGFYPKGSLGRLAFGLLAIVATIIYALALLLNGSLESFLNAQGLIIDLDEIWLLILVLIAFASFLRVGEFLDHRRAWRISVGRPVKPYAEEAPHSLPQDFRPRYGRFETGAKEGRKAVRKYFVSPALIVMIVRAVVVSLIASFQMSDLSFITQYLQDIYAIIVVFALPIIVLVFFRGFYPKGSFSRLCFGWTVAVTIAIWIWAVTLGGKISSNINLGLTSLGINLDFLGLVYLFMIASLLWGLYYTAEFFSYRKSWIANEFQPVDDHGALMAKEEQRLQEKELKRAQKEEKRMAAQSSEERKKGNEPPTFDSLEATPPEVKGP